MPSDLKQMRETKIRMGRNIHPGECCAKIAGSLNKRNRPTAHLRQGKTISPYINTVFAITPISPKSHIQFSGKKEALLCLFLPFEAARESGSNGGRNELSQLSSYKGGGLMAE